MSGGHGGGGRRHKKVHEEEHENHERWLVSYADMMTLLMVLFLVMFAISQVDQKKFEQLRNGLAISFGSESVAMQGAGSDLTEEKESAPKVEPQVGEPPDPAKDQQLVEAIARADRARQSLMAQHAATEVQNLEEVREKINEQLVQHNLADAVRFTIDERGLVVTIMTSGVVFAGDRADLLPAGRQIIDAIAPAVAILPNGIQVDGHTNQLPVDPVNYPSGWELSSARAASVVRYLHGTHGLPEIRLTASGYADTRPLYPASDPRAVTMNRRVEVVVLSTLPPQERALLPSAAARHK